MTPIFVVKIRKNFFWLLFLTIAASVFPTIFVMPQSPNPVSKSVNYWSTLPSFKLQGGLKVYWRIGDNSKMKNSQAAYSHGFSPLTELNPYADYPGNQKENINKFLKQNNINPWKKPLFFERIIRRNIDASGSVGTFVQDIEFAYEEDVDRAWNNPEVRQASQSQNIIDFRRAYFREWARWYWLPLIWTKQRYPGTLVGLYGVQPFRRDYWGISGKNAAQIDGSHITDMELWEHIEPYVDFYVASVYNFYESPDSVFYMAANVEENYNRTRRFGQKPVFAYTWLRYHGSNLMLRKRELAPYLVETMALVPFFSGAKAVVLWGYEPQVKPGDALPYERLGLFMQSIKRLEPLSARLGKAKLIIDIPAHVAWKAKLPLIRKMQVPGRPECIVMAVNPWQDEGAETSVNARCNNKDYPIILKGKRTAIVDIVNGKIVMY